MDWLRELFADPTSIEASLLILSLVIALGLVLGSISIRGIRLGVAGILFAGLAFGHYGLAPNATVLGFAREFGLVLFVFAVGLSVGPGFFNALRSQGLSLNLLALGVVALGVAITATAIVVSGVAGPIAVGLFSGATTNTPSLAAAGQALRDHPPSDAQARAALAQVAPDHPLVKSEAELTPEQRAELMSEVVKLPGMAYALSYPGGVFGIIAAILLLRWMFRVDPVAEAADLEAKRRQATPPLVNMFVRVTNPNLLDNTIAEIPAIESLGVVVSRLIRGNENFVASDETKIAAGDVLLVVGRQEELSQFVKIVGEPATIDIAALPTQIQVRWLVVSRRSLARLPIEELSISRRFGVQITRVRRAGVELPPDEDLPLAMGDEIRVVGLPENIDRVAKEFGNSPRKLGEPELLPVFIAIALGVLVGSIPFTLPGIPGAVKLGIAGGPLIAAILLSRQQRIGPIVWYLPRSAILTLKDVGIAVFLAAVGLKSGDLFVDAFTQGAGVRWLITGAVITLVPLVVVGCIARLVMKEHYVNIIGLLAGSMTDPPALAFANTLTKSEMPSVAYATVYPLTMIARVIAAQLMMMYWAS
jgi:putative transport protein